MLRFDAGVQPATPRLRQLVVPVARCSEGRASTSARTPARSPSLWATLRRSRARASVSAVRGSLDFVI